MTSSQIARHVYSMNLIREAIEELRRHFFIYVAGTVLASIPCIMMAVFGTWEWISKDLKPEECLWQGAVFFAIFILTFNVFLTGCCRVAMLSLEGTAPRLKDFFDPTRNLPCLVVTLLSAVGLVVGMTVCLVGGLVVASLLFVALPCAGSGEKGGIAAARWSWATLKKRSLEAFAVCNLVHVAAISGVFLL